MVMSNKLYNLDYNLNTLGRKGVGEGGVGIEGISDTCLL